MQQNIVTCPNCGTNGFTATSKLIILHRIILITSIIFTIGCAISIIGLIFLIPIFPFIVGVNIITYILRKTIKEDLKCTCMHCKNVWILKGRKKTWF